MFIDDIQDNSPEIELEETTEEVETEQTTEEVDTQEESVDWEAEAKKWKGIAQRHKTKEEKAVKTAQSTDTTLTARDLLAITKAGIDPEDLDDVLEFASFKKISIADALNTSVIKATLAEKNEVRKSALATNTGSARRAGTAVSDAALLDNARKGILPDSAEDIGRLMRLRRGG